MASIGEVIKIKGIALRAGISRNNVIYTPEEMMKTAGELANKPILMDHESKSTHVIGKTTFAKFMQNENAIYYEGWIKETGFGIIEAIKDERLNTVSIGAMSEELVEDDNKQTLARGIHYMELSTTPTPGVVGTSLSQALATFNDTNKKVPYAENVKLFSESATDTSKPLFSDSTTTVMPKDNILRLRCPMYGCDYTCIGDPSRVDEFEQHMLEVHNWPDSTTDDYLRMMGITENPADEEAEKDEKDIEVSNNLGADIGKNEQPAKPVMQKQPYESKNIDVKEEEKTEIQSLIFSKDKFDEDSAKKWAEDNNFKFGSVDITDDTIRLRQKEPGQYKRFRTIDMTTGVQAVIGVKDESKEESKMLNTEEAKVKNYAKGLKSEEELKAEEEAKKKLNAQADDAAELPADDAEEEEEEEKEEEMPVAYKSDEPAQKGYQPGFVPKPGKYHRAQPFDQVSASLKKRDMVIEQLLNEVKDLKTQMIESKKVSEKGLVEVQESVIGSNRTYDVKEMNLRLEKTDNGKWAFWRMPKGPKGQL